MLPSLQPIFLGNKGSRDITSRPQPLTVPRALQAGCCGGGGSTSTVRCIGI